MASYISPTLAMVNTAMPFSKLVLAEAPAALGFQLQGRAFVHLTGGEKLPLERFWRDARVERIWDGTSEIQRNVIATQVLGLSGSVTGIIIAIGLLSCAAPLFGRTVLVWLINAGGFATIVAYFFVPIAFACVT